MVSSVGIREFRVSLTGYIASGEPVEVTRRGQVVGVFVPTPPLRRFDVEPFLAVADGLWAALTQAKVDPEEVVREFDEIRHTRA